MLNLSTALSKYHYLDTNFFKTQLNTDSWQEIKTQLKTKPQTQLPTEFPVLSLLLHKT